MTARTRYRIGNAVIALCVIMLAVELLMMIGVLPNHGASRVIGILVVAFVVVAGAIRRNARAEMAAEAATANAPT
jgi:uncharacterized membrane protein YoaK (UPF0700 family)